MTEQLKKLISLFKGKKSVGLKRSEVESLARGTLKLLEPMSHRMRVKHLVLLGQASREKEIYSAEIVELVESLTVEHRAAIANFFTALAQGGDFQERYLALISCFGSENGAHVRASLKDSSRIIRDTALSMLAAVLTDEELEETFQTLELSGKKRVLLGLRKKRRFALIDPLIETFIESGCPEKDVAELLPFASQAFIREQWVICESSFGELEWAKLARIHPSLAVSLMKEKVTALDFADPRILHLANIVLQIVSSRAADGGLDLIDSMVVHYALPDIAYENYIFPRPEKVSRLFLDSQISIPVSLEAILPRLNEKLMLDMVRKMVTGSSRMIGAYGVQEWMKKISPEARAKLYHEFKDSWRDGNGAIPCPVIELMPAAIRKKEGAAHLKMAPLEGELWGRLPYAKLLGFQQCREELSSYLGDPEPETRAVAVRPLVDSVKYDRDSAGELLEFLESRKNEPDPVRMAFVLSLAELPPGIWKESHLAGLEQVIRGALNAKDLSPSTVAYLGSLIVALVPFHLDWAGKWLATILKERHYLQLGDQTSRLNDAHVKALSPHFVPVLRTLQKMEKERAILSLAGTFNRRLSQFKELEDMVEELVLSASNVYVSQQALGIVFAHCKGKLEELIPRLLRKDPTWFQDYNVRRYIHSCRQDLLTPYLGQRAFKGRFGTGKTCVVPRFDGGFQRWSREQRRIYEKSLESLASDRDEHSVGDIFLALDGLSTLPDASIETILRYARLKEPDKQAVRDRAIYCLSRLDNGGGVKELIDCLSDERARSAIYVLREALLEMERDEALDILTDAPRRQITVAKEIVRLIGELRSDNAFVTLVEINQTELHRDVKIALLRALWNFLDRDETWNILEATARQSDRSVALHMVRIPSTRISVKAEDRLVELLASLLSFEEPMVRIAVLNRCRTMPVSDRHSKLKEGLLQSMTSKNSSEFSAAIHALLITYGVREPDSIEAAVTKIHKNRRVLDCFVTALISSFKQQGERLLPAVKAAMAALEEDKLSISRQLSLACQTLPFDEVVSYIEKIHANGSMHPMALMTTVGAIELAGRRADSENLIMVEEAFADHQSEELRRVGLAALCALSSSSRGWTRECLNRLERFRKDDSAMVAEAAQFVLPSAELALSEAL